MNHVVVPLQEDILAIRDKASLPQNIYREFYENIKGPF